MAAQLTREFSICLLPADDVANDIQALRQDLPASPYRDDIPHITLLRGITSNADMSDEELAQDVESVLSISERLPLGATVQSIANKSNQFYTDTGVVLMKALPELLAFRQKVADLLAQHGYSIESQELHTYIPHITIRLGVPLEGAMLQQAEALFSGRAIAFSHWVLFRLVMEDGERMMRQVWPY